jgi:hypothetical protein
MPAQVPGYDTTVEESHVAVAATVASGAADVGPGVEAAALEFGLHFVPLVEEDYFLVCLKANLDTPPVLRLRAVLAGAAWAEMLDKLPGYRPVAETRQGAGDDRRTALVALHAPQGRCRPRRAQGLNRQTRRPWQSGTATPKPSAGWPCCCARCTWPAWWRWARR